MGALRPQSRGEARDGEADQGEAGEVAGGPLTS
jgi:hypothetical protein